MDPRARLLLIVVRRRHQIHLQLADDCKLLCGYSEPNSGSLLDQQGPFLTNEPALQPTYLVK